MHKLDVIVKKIFPKIALSGRKRGRFAGMLSGQKNYICSVKAVYGKKGSREKTIASLVENEDAERGELQSG